MEDYLSKIGIHQVESLNLNTSTLKLELARYIASKDSLEKVLIKNEIQSKYKISNRDFYLALEVMEDKNKKACVEVLTIDDLESATKGKDSWLIPNILPSHGTVLFGGETGIGKLDFVIDMTASILTGDDFLGEKPSHPENVFIVGSASFNLTNLKHKMNLRNSESSKWKRCHVITNWDVTQFDLLEQKINYLDPKLVVIYDFAGIHSVKTFDENSAKARKTIQDFSFLCSKYNLSTVIVHNTRKERLGKNTSISFRGSSAIPTTANTNWILSGNCYESTRTFYAPKVNFSITKQPCLINFNQTKCRFDVVKPDFSQKDTTLCSLSERILYRLYDDPQGLSMRDIYQSVASIQSAAKKVRVPVGEYTSLLLAPLIECGLILPSQKGKTIIYLLADQELEMPTNQVHEVLRLYTDSNLKIAKLGKVKVGLPSMDSSKFLYPNYCAWCKSNDTLPLSLIKFSDIFVDFLKYHMRVPMAAKYRDRFGSHILGIEIKSDTNFSNILE
jgi:hypothetical protein